MNKKWGIGIEHEMRVRFTKSFSELSDDIKKTLPNLKNEYIFMNSNVILYYFKIYETTFFSNNSEKYIDIINDKLYFDNLLLKKNLIELAKKNMPFPLNDTNYFNLNDNNNINTTIDFLNIYLMAYTLYNTPLLFFRYK